MAKIRVSYKNMRKIHGIVFVLPWLIGFILFFITPLANTIKYSFHNVGVADTGGMVQKYVGLQNYIDLFKVEVSSQSKQFLRIFSDENLNIFVNTPVIVVFSLFCAILINVKFKGQGLARVIFFLPIVLGLKVVVDLIMVTTGGDVADAAVSERFDNGMIIDFLLTYTFLPLKVSIFISDLANNVFLLLSQTGVQTLIFLAGLQSINKSLYEVAKIEGASSYEVFWKITLPLMSNISLFAFIYTFVDMFLKSSISTEVYYFAFNKNNIGVGSALSVVYLFNVLLDLLLLLLILSRVVKLNHAAK
ncbi:ABC transporter permease subunit [Cohnella sp. CFH 77786]|uniref:carbohydrate ABC transporter permease n=1 Tax=Cohnella sp. CFH 77786 TaxID=2662265 RepID=UPI001C610FC4|nr:sugar ABC transporter permease [Cohnella sp. CFH 77786]MBW5445788.1 ABC transporter permease subunit [Cohnella sp. CFH 77786]